MRKIDFLYSVILAVILILGYHFIWKTSKTIDTEPEEVLMDNEEPRTYDESLWSDIKDFDPTIIIDMRYATENNFVNEQMYTCGKCFLRPVVAEALVAANIEFGKAGYRIKVFDCYRPKPVQQALWDKVPNPNYVTPPEKGSMHNRGAAVDLTLVDENGYELNMGTGFDFFGEQAHHDFTDLPQDVLDNRTLLKTTLENHGFRSIRTEWWHYSYNASGFDISEWMWACD